MEHISWPAVGPNQGFERRTSTLEAPGSDEVIVEVAGCGVCHTDVSYYEGGVAPISDWPLVLGHEISGRVVEAGPDCDDWVGKAVVVPAVAPCGACAACKRGRPTACTRGWMPGNNGPGGFASHLKVPARGLCPVNEDRLGEVALAELGAVADAVTTPLQATTRAGLREDEVAIIVGVGGIGGFCVQIAKAIGAKVIAIDIDDGKLSRYADYCVTTVNARDKDAKALKKEVRGVIKEAGLPGDAWRIFECSGTGAGQQTAFSLLARGGSLSVVGFSPEVVPVRLSNVMALDAELYGNWGCDPALYPEAVDMVLSGKIALKEFVELRPLSTIADVFAAAHSGELVNRVVLQPDEGTAS